MASVDFHLQPIGPPPVSARSFERPRDDPIRSSFTKSGIVLSPSLETASGNRKPLFKREMLRLTILLILGGTFAAVLSSSIDGGVTGVVTLLGRVAHAPSNRGLGYLAYTCCVSFLVLAAVTITTIFAPGAAGSGVGELKIVLSGAPIPEDHFSFRVLIVKTACLVLGLGSGAILGKEGPMIHLSCIITLQLLRLPYFNDLTQFIYGLTLLQNPRLIQQALSAACAAGVAANFVSPIGGILFSVEATSTVFPVREFHWAAIAALSAAFTSRQLESIKRNDFAGMSISIGEVPYGPFAWMWFIILVYAAIAIGLLAVLILRSASYWLRFHKKMQEVKLPCTATPFVYAFAVSLYIAMVTFPRWGHPLWGAQRRAALVMLFDPDTYVPLGTMALFLASRMIGQLLCLPLMMPGGVIVPSFLIGGSIGRLYGEALQKIWQFSFPGPAGYFTANVFALAGSAALAGSVTQVLSCAVVLFELTGRLRLLLEILVTTLIAYSIARNFAIPIFDLLLKKKVNLYLPDLPMKYWLVDVGSMVQAVPRLTPYSIVAEMRSALINCNLSTLAVVDTLDSNTLVGYVSRRELRDFLETHLAETTLLEEAVHIHRSLITITEQTPLEEFHLLIVTLRRQEMFVVREAKLMGAVTREGYKKVMAALQKGSHSLLQCGALW